MAFGTGLNHAMREAAIWVVVMIAGFVSFYYFDDVYAALRDRTSEPQVATDGDTPSQSSDSGEKLVAISADRQGHFAVSSLINGTHVELLADTGATAVSLTYKDARRAGIDLDALKWTIKARTANGITRGAPVTLGRVVVGQIVVRDVRAIVHEPGKLHISLLGMSFIGRLSRFELRGRQLVLIQ